MAMKAYGRKHTPVKSKDTMKMELAPERKRENETLQEYVLTEEERQEIIRKYGPPLRPLGTNKSIVHMTKGKKGGAA
ncbi:hypothetical protein [Paenibacillus sp. Marseille-Q4541]|uniref:hypothetical protein n=1 Tax=Paenibacillus TaxID=44249 RepID=UPI001961FA11|nr:hypothetical protein [Paenibacillus sp. Marseille-Q4541]